MIKLVNTKILGDWQDPILEYEALSTDNLNSILPATVKNIGSTVFCVDTGDVYKLNVDNAGNPKWYKL